MHARQNAELLRQEVATVVRNARGRLGYTQGRMAEVLGVSQPNVSRYETGSAEPPATVLMHCLHICGLVSEVPAGLAREDQSWSEILAALGHLETAIHSAAQAAHE